MSSDFDHNRIAWTTCRDGVSVSTVRLPLHDFETAICYENEITIVEKYKSADDALAGHARYVKRHSGPAARPRKRWSLFIN